MHPVGVIDFISLLASSMALVFLLIGWKHALRRDVKLLLLGLLGFTLSLDDLVIADADQDPHLFVDDRDETRRKIESGIYRPLETCSRAKCDNVTQPRFRECAIHVDPPLATRRPR